MKTEIQEITNKPEKINIKDSAEKALNKLGLKTQETPKDVEKFLWYSLKLAEFTDRNEEECISFLKNNLDTSQLLPS